MFESKYRILRELGSGGEGTVYLVQHILTEQLRAAKLLKNVQGKCRFQEVNAMKRLEHPSLPQIYDVLEEDNRIWLIMEYVKGRRLSQIPVGEISMEDFFSIATQLAEVLAYLHGRDCPVLHLDIKPTNLLLKENGILVLIDFGAAVRKTADASRTDCFGTPGFAAPEQFCKGLADERSDIYGAGAVLYYYFFHMKPEKGGYTAAEMKQMLSGVKYLQSRPILKILEKCLYEEPSQRFQSALALKHALEHARKRDKRRKKVKGAFSAVVLFCSGMAFLLNQITENTMSQEERAQKMKEERYAQYEKLLDQAKQLGFEQAAACYKEAAGYSDGDGKWILQFIERITDDYSFTLYEETQMKNLLFELPIGKDQSVVEYMKERSEQYDELFYKIGLAYWYYYEGAGGKSAAAEWFLQAVEGKELRYENGKMEEAWIGNARIYAQISSYYNELGKTEADGVEQVHRSVYWRDLQKLWNRKDRYKENPVIQKRLAEELVSCMLFYTVELKQDGIKEQDLLNLLLELHDFAEKYDFAELRELNKNAETAVRRNYFKKTDSEKERKGETDGTGE